jgi:hypothetical protein
VNKLLRLPSPLTNRDAFHFGSFSSKTDMAPAEEELPLHFGYADSCTLTKSVYARVESGVLISRNAWELRRISLLGAPTKEHGIFDMPDFSVGGQVTLPA